MTTETQPADFYVGRGPTATYLGSTLGGGHPHHLNVWDVFQSRDDQEYTEATFRAYVARVATGGTQWPHFHPTSAGTSWAYCYDRGTTYVYHHGVEVAQIRANYHLWQYARENAGDRIIVDRTRREPGDRPQVAWPKVGWPNPRTDHTTPHFSSGGAQ